MMTINSKSSSAIHPHELTAQELLAVGRLVRAVSELDEIASLYLDDLADLSGYQSRIILGKMPTSTRLRLARVIAETHGKEALAKHEECFDNPAYRAVMKFRNTVVHGILLGKTDNGYIAFAIQEIAGTDEALVFSTVNAYHPTAFDAFAKLAEQATQELSDRLKLRSSREKLRQRVLSPHPKARRSKTPAIRHLDPPPS